MKVYLDETGASGNNVDDAEQPYFVMGSVLIEEAEAAAIMDGLRTLLSSKAPELKSSILRKRPDGAAGYEFVLERLTNRARAVAYDKHVVVFMKAYDYLLDPIDSSYFAGVGLHQNLHRRVALELAREAKSGEMLATSLYEAVVAALRHKNFEPLERYCAAPATRRSSIAALMHRIAIKHHALIRREFEAVHQLGAVGAWILDMSLPGVRWNVSYWAKRAENLVVVCDNSKPLYQQADFLSLALQANGDHPELTGPDYKLGAGISTLELADSKSTPGLQLADVVAGAVSDSLRGRLTNVRVARMIDRNTSVLAEEAPGIAVISKSAALRALQRYE